jgi:hypothetical protein
VNKSLGNLLGSLVREHPNQWDHVLAQAKFTYNDSSNRSTSQSPFHIAYGIHPRGVYELRNLGKAKLRSDKGEDFASEMQAIHAQVKQKL